MFILQNENLRTKDSLSHALSQLPQIISQKSTAIETSLAFSMWEK